MARKDKGKGAADAPDTGSTKITPVDIQQKEFRESFRGYNERDVDQFLDQVTEEMARLHSENKRLQEQVEFRQTLPMGSASAEAEEIMRRAKAEADRIIERARGVAGGGTVYGSPQPQSGGLDTVEMVNRYLAREREFLQSLASRIQQHIEAVREDVRTVREVERGGGGPEAVEPVDPGVGALSTRESSDDEPPDVEYLSPQDVAAPEYPSPHDPAAEYQGPEVSLRGYAAEDDRAADVLSGGLSGEEDASVVPGWTAEESSPEESGDGPPEVDQSPGDDPGTARWTREDGGSSWAEQGAAVPGPADTSERERQESPSASLGHVESSTGPSVGVPRPEDDAGEERSLRELFWGED